MEENRTSLLIGPAFFALFRARTSIRVVGVSSAAASIPSGPRNDIGLLEVRKASLLQKLIASYKRFHKVFFPCDRVTRRHGFSGPVSVSIFLPILSFFSVAGTNIPDFSRTKVWSHDDEEEPSRVLESELKTSEAHDEKVCLGFIFIRFGHSPRDIRISQDPSPRVGRWR